MTTELKVRLRGPGGTSSLMLPTGSDIATSTVGELKTVVRTFLKLASDAPLTLRIDLSRKMTELRDDAATLQSISCSPVGQLFVVDAPRPAASSSAAVTIADATSSSGGGKSSSSSSSSSASAKRKAPPKPKGPPREKKPRAVIAGSFVAEGDEDEDEGEGDIDNNNEDVNRNETAVAREFDASALADALLGAEDTTKETFGLTALHMALSAARMHALTHPDKAKLTITRDPRSPAHATASFSHNQRPFQERFALLSDDHIAAAVRAVLKRTSTQRRVNSAGTRAVFSVPSLCARGMGPPVLFSLWMGLGARGAGGLGDGGGGGGGGGRVDLSALTARLGVLVEDALGLGL